MVSIRNYINLNRKGQGIVEYAVLLAFIVGLAVMLQGTGISGEVKNTFDSVANLLGGGAKSAYASALEKWGKIPQSELLDDKTKAERIKADQEALANIGEFFIGMSKENVKICS